MRYGASLAVAILSTSLGNGAFAGVAIYTEAVTADGKSSQQTMFVTPDRRKIDMEKIAIIVRTDTGKIVTVMKDKHEYTEIDPKQVSADIAAVQAQMQQRLQAVPDAQRKQIEEMLARHGVPGEPAAEPTYEKTGQTKTVGAWSCQVYHQKRGGSVEADLCITPAAAVGITQDDLAAFRTFGEKMRKSLPDDVRRNASLMDFDAQTRQIGFEGIPVETVVYRDGKARTTMTVKSVDHAPLPPDLFEVPAGYTRKEMPGFGRGGAAPSSK